MNEEDIVRSAPVLIITLSYYLVWAFHAAWSVQVQIQNNFVAVLHKYICNSSQHDISALLVVNCMILIFVAYSLFSINVYHKDISYIVHIY